MKAITTIHTAQTQYYSQYGHYASSLKRLGPPTGGASGENAANLIDLDLASGNKGGVKFALRLTKEGYELTVRVGKHTYYSDQTMLIRKDGEPAPVKDPLFYELIARQ